MQITVQMHSYANLSHYKYSFKRNQYIDCEKKITIMNLF